VCEKYNKVRLKNIILLFSYSVPRYLTWEEYCFCNRLYFDIFAKEKLTSMNNIIPFNIRGGSRRAKQKNVKQK